MPQSNAPDIEAIDLFCGAGGLTCGLQKAGIPVRLGVDVDPACKYPYEHNNKTPILLRDVKEISSEEIGGYFTNSGSVRLVAGCAPCQTFSSYNQKASKTDSRWWLLKEFERIVDELGPELVTMENVPGVALHSVFDDFFHFLKKAGYQVSAQVVKCADYGMPQQRERMVVLASRLGPIELLTPSAFRAKRQTVRDAIAKLPPIAAGEMDENDPLHMAAALSPLNMKRIRASRPGGSWREWPADLVASCHKKNTGKNYPGVYGRMTWDDPAPTITTQHFGFGNGRFGHPEQDRAISLREGAILQSFPRSYRFTPPGSPVHITAIGRLIGNAVPVKLGEVVGKSFLQHLHDLRNK